MIRYQHGFRRADGESGLHEGRVEKCLAPECQWPQLGILMTVLDDEGRERTGDLMRHEGVNVRIRVNSGTEYVAPLPEAREVEWGTYCTHGLKIVEAVPTAHTCGRPVEDSLGVFSLAGPGSFSCLACYPAERKVQPWPCQEDGCTEADFDRAQEREIEEYWESVNDLMRTQYE